MDWRLLSVYFLNLVSSKSFLLCYFQVTTIFFSSRDNFYWEEIQSTISQLSNEAAFRCWASFKDNKINTTVKITARPKNHNENIYVRKSTFNRRKEMRTFNWRYFQCRNNHPIPCLYWKRNDHSTYHTQTYQDLYDLCSHAMNQLHQMLLAFEQQICLTIIVLS